MARLHSTCHKYGRPGKTRGFLVAYSRVGGRARFRKLKEGPGFSRGGGLDRPVRGGWGENLRGAGRLSAWVRQRGIPIKHGRLIHGGEGEESPRRERPSQGGRARDRKRYVGGGEVMP